MADNYIERREEELRNVPRGKHPGGTASLNNLDALLGRNRSTRGYDPSYKVHILQLRAIASVMEKIPSARNQQVLRLRLVCADEAAKVLPYIKMGGALPELHLPFPGTEPGAFIVICTNNPAAPNLGFDEGVAAQSMCLKAVEMGLNCLIIKCFDAAKVKESLGIGTDRAGRPLTPLTVIAVGKSAEKISIEKVPDPSELSYYRNADGEHIVPKIRLDDIICDCKK